MTRVLVLCTHNSARSQMAEGWLRHYALEHGLELEVWSAGTEATTVKREAVQAMREAGIDISGHFSKRFDEVPEPWRFDAVLTVCDSAAEACPSYPAQTRRLHASFPDPTGKDIAHWRQTRDAIGAMSGRFVRALSAGRIPSEDEIV